MHKRILLSSGARPTSAREWSCGFLLSQPTECAPFTAGAAQGSPDKPPVSRFAMESAVPEHASDHNGARSARRALRARARRRANHGDIRVPTRSRCASRGHRAKFRDLGRLWARESNFPARPNPSLLA